MVSFVWFFGTSEAGLDGQIALLSLPLLKSTGDTCDPSTLLNSPALALMVISLLALMVSSGMQRLYVQKAAYNHAGCWPAHILESEGGGISHWYLACRTTSGTLQPDPGALPAAKCQ